MITLTFELSIFIIYLNDYKKYFLSGNPTRRTNRQKHGLNSIVQFLRKSLAVCLE